MFVLCENAYIYPVLRTPNKNVVETFLVVSEMLHFYLCSLATCIAAFSCYKYL